MPNILSFSFPRPFVGNTVANVFMCGEKMSDMIKEDYMGAEYGADISKEDYMGAENGADINKKGYMRKHKSG